MTPTIDPVLSVILAVCFWLIVGCAVLLLNSHYQSLKYYGSDITPARFVVKVCAACAACALVIRVTAYAIGALFN